MYYGVSLNSYYMNYSESFFESVLNKPNAVLREDENIKIQELTKLEPYSEPDPEDVVTGNKIPTSPRKGHGLGDKFN